MSVSYGGDSITFADSSTISSGWTGFKNRIINGAITIDQRYAGASNTPSSTAYVMDRWRAAVSASKMSVQQMNGVNTSASNYESGSAPTGFTNSIKVTTTTANTPNAGDYFGVNQLIEGYNVADLDWGKSTAKTVTLSFWVKSSLTGTFGGGIRTGDNANYSYPFTYTISAANTWTYTTVTIPGPTAGTWATGNGHGVDVWFSLGTGSTFSATANTWASSNYVNATGSVNLISTLGATWYITGVQFERGSTASSFEFRPIGTELALCQRYFCKSGSMNTPVPAVGAVYTNNDNFIAGTFNGYAANNGFAPFLLFPVEMRTVPTLTFIPSNLGGTTNQISIWVGSAWIGTSPALQTFNSRGFNLFLSGSWSVGPWLTYYAYTASSEL